MNLLPAREAFCPLFAPMPCIWGQSLFQEHARSARGTSEALSPQEALERFWRTWEDFDKKLRQMRLDTFRDMDSLVREDRAMRPRVKEQNISPRWVQEKVGVSADTLSVWYDKGIVRKIEWGRLDYQTVAAVVFAKSLNKDRRRNFVPAHMQSQELWYCWSQASPESPWIPCPYPLPSDIAPTTLLWTHWPGAAWEMCDPSWRQVETLGAIRFAGRVGREDLRRWDPDAAQRSTFGGSSTLEGVLDTLAETRFTLYATRGMRGLGRFMNDPETPNAPSNAT